jgi:hypothetical protein
MSVEFEYDIDDRVRVLPLDKWGIVKEMKIDAHKNLSYHIYLSSGHMIWCSGSNLVKRVR